MTLIVTWLWQGLAIAGITAAAVRAMPRLNAVTRHAVWWLALAAVLAIPLAHGLAAVSTGTPSAPDLTGALDAAGAVMLPAIPDGVVACAVAIWAITVAVGALRIARCCRALGRLKRASSPFDRSREARLPLWVGARDGGHRAAELRTSDCITGASALGLGQPVILVSRSVADALNDQSLDEIVMHEQAHLDRYDDWSQLLQAVVGSLAGLHPAVRFLARRMDVDREAACDDRVVSRTGAARRYASSLLAVAAASSPKAVGVAFAAGVPTATTTASALRVRVGRLLDRRRDRGARLASATSLVSVTALAVAVAVAMSTQLAPAVIFLETVAVNAPAAAVPAIEVRGTPAPRAKVDAAAWGLERPQRHLSRRVTRPIESGPPEAAVHPFAGTHETVEAPRRCHSTAASLRRTSTRPCSKCRGHGRHRLASLRRQRLSCPPGTQSARPRRLPPVVPRARLRRPASAPGAPVSQSAVSLRAPAKLSRKIFSLIKPSAFRRTSSRPVMRVFLVNPSHVSFGTAVITPRWLYVLAAATPSGCGEPIVADETLDPFDAAQLAPGDVVGIGIHTGNALRGYEVEQLARARGAYVVFGGIHATLYPAEAHALGGAHAVVRGDGDVIWATVIDDCAAGTPRQIYEAGRIAGETFKSARWDLLPKDRYMWGSIQTVRGCPKHCSFCSVWRTDGQAPRQAAVPAVIHEAVALRRRGFRFIALADDNFYPVTLADLAQAARRSDPSHLRALEAVRAERFALMDGLAALPDDMMFFTQITMEAAEDPAFLQAMARARIRGALVGVEAVTPEGLKDVHKGFNLVGEPLVERLQTFRSHGVHVLGSFIFGLPSDRPATFRATADLAERAGITFAQFVMLTPYPGTVDFERWERELGGDAATVSGIPVTRHWLIPQADRPKAYAPHPVMSPDEIRRRTQAVWDHFYSLPRVWRRSRVAGTWKGRLAFVLSSKLYRQMYANTGIATDSARRTRSARVARWMAGPCRRLFAAAPMPHLEVPGV